MGIEEVAEKLGDAPPKDGALYRGIVGIGALTAGIMCMGGLFIIHVPPENKEALLIAIGVILGWGSSVVNYEFGSSPYGRKAAERGLRAEQERGDAA